MDADELAKVRSMLAASGLEPTVRELAANEDMRPQLDAILATFGVSRADLDEVLK